MEKTSLFRTAVSATVTTGIKIYPHIWCFTPDFGYISYIYLKEFPAGEFQCIHL
jgi:hypothetical protein